MISVRAKMNKDSKWISEMIFNEWGSDIVVSKGIIYDPIGIEGIVAELDNTPVGFLSFWIMDNECEIITLNSFQESKGIGTALIQEVERIAHKYKCHRLWLITTNDNTRALCFYKKNGFKIVAIHKDAVKESRKLKPEIPILGFDNVPILDEVELEKDLK